MAKGQSQELAHAIDRMVDGKLRRTQPRIAILELLTQEHGPFSIEQIRTRIKKVELDVVTVYRCLAAFEKIRIVRRCDFGDGVARYEFQSSEDHHHHHIVCVSCRKSETLDSCSLPKLDHAVRKLGYTDITHRLEFFGRCPECSGE